MTAALSLGFKIVSNYGPQVIAYSLAGTASSIMMNEGVLNGCIFGALLGATGSAGLELVHKVNQYIERRREYGQLNHLESSNVKALANVCICSMIPFVTAAESFAMGVGFSSVAEQVKMTASTFVLGSLFLAFAICAK